MRSHDYDKYEPIDLPGGHREFYVETDLYDRLTGQLVGMGVGLATTLETKWRYRSGPVTFTGRSVPREYWELRQWRRPWRVGPRPWR